MAEKDESVLKGVVAKLSTLTWEDTLSRQFLLSLWEEIPGNINKSEDTGKRKPVQ